MSQIDGRQLPESKTILKDYYGYFCVSRDDMWAFLEYCRKFRLFMDKPIDPKDVQDVWWQMDKIKASWGPAGHEKIKEKRKVFPVVEKDWKHGKNAKIVNQTGPMAEKI